jgi:putative phosphoesterase
MVIGVISDTHLDNVTAEFVSLVEDRLSDCDLVVHAGDFIVPAVYFYLNKVTQGNLVAVCGNMDPPRLCRMLPDRLVFEKLGIKIGLIHGWGASKDLEDRIVNLFHGDDVRCIIYGHSHYAANHTVNDILFFNPGSPTDRAYDKGKSIGYVTIQDDKITGEVVLI